MVYIVITLYITLNVFFDIYEFSRRYISAGLLVSASQFAMFVGIAKLANFHNKADVTLLGIYLFGYIVFVSLYLALSSKYSFSDIELKTNFEINKYQTVILYCMIIVSVIFSTWFFAQTGTHILSVIVSSFFSGSSVNISQMRKAVNYTRGNGVVYQFRNFILPLSVMYFVMFEEGINRTIGIILLPITILFLIGSGQRAGVVYLLMITGLTVALITKAKKKIENVESDIGITIKRTLLTIVMLIVIFVFLTALNGRDIASGSLINAVTDRFINDNQACAILGFRYIYEQDITFGADWGSMFLDLFRENRYIPVSSIIHAQLYGSLQGTSPPCIWGSAYYNFGYFGVVLIASLLAIVSKELYSHFCKKANNGLRIILYAGMSVLFSAWIADSPIMLLNGGFATIVMMSFVLFPKVVFVLKK